MNEDAARLRRHMRRQLSELGTKGRERPARQAIARFVATPEFRRCRRIALFYPVRHEISLLPLAALCWACAKRVYLPVLRPPPFEKMAFLRYTRNTRLRLNRFHIPEPVFARAGQIAPAGLDIVVMPLLAFGAHGERLGQGGGFYDRTFAFLHRRRRPMAWAIALDLQQAEFAARPWDVSLRAVATPSRVIRFAP